MAENQGPPADENVVSMIRTSMDHSDLTNVTFGAPSSLTITNNSMGVQQMCPAGTHQCVTNASKSSEIQMPHQSADNQNPGSSPKSPKITIPLSALTSLTSMQTNDTASTNNTLVDIQQLQAFLMALQQPAAQSPTISNTEANLQPTTTFESSNLDSLQAAGIDNCGILVDSQAMQGTMQPTAQVMPIQQLVAGSLQGVSSGTIQNQLQPHQSTDNQDSSKQSTAQAEMIAVEVLTHSVSDDNQSQPIQSQQEAIASSTNETPNVINLVQAQVMNGSQLYSLQINGQTIPFTTIQLPLSQADELNQQASCLQITAADGLTMNPEILTSSADLNPLNVAAGSLQLPCTPSKESLQSASSVTPLMPSSFSKKSTLSEGKEKYTCEICGKVYVRSWSYYGHMREHANGENQHRCDVCGKTFNCDSNLKQHMLIHTGIKPYKCDMCEKAFNNQSSLRIHALSHSEDKPYVCDVEECGKSFSNPSSLRVHQRVHQTEKPFKCTHPGCNLAFKTSSELSRHSFRHSGAKPHKCNTCDKSFVRYDDLKRHHFIHTGVKQFKCDQCDFACIQSFDLVKHKYTHGGEKPYKCEQCSKQFTRPARLREHMRQHTGEKPYQCEQCGKAFTQMTSLKSHLLSHSGTKPYKCDICSKGYTTAADLRAHRNNHTGQRPYKCDICSKDFISAKTLKKHAIVHSGEKPFECGECNRRFARASDLKVHMPVHSDDKPFKCDSCEKMFTRLNTLKEHARTHTGEFPFKCEHCDKLFNHRSHLNVHLRTHTGEKPFKCNLCDREFARKSSLRYHARVHLLGEASSPTTKTQLLSERDYEEYSPADSLDSHGVEIEIANSDNITSIEAMSTPGKRKRDSSPEYEAGESFMRKRIATEEDIIRNAAERLQTNTDVNMSDSEKLQMKSESDHLLIREHNSLILTGINQQQMAISSSTTSDLLTVDASKLQDNEGQVARTLIQLPNLEDATDNQSKINVDTQGCISMSISNPPSRTLLLEENPSCEQSNVTTNTTLPLTGSLPTENS